MTSESKDFPSRLRAEIPRLAEASGISESRIRRWIAFERFLARVPSDGSWLLKGSFAMELLFRPSCRPAEDLDFTLPKAPRMQYNPPPDIISIAQRDVNDGFRFESTPISETIEAWQEGTTYGRGRAEVKCFVGNDELAAFHVDADFGDIPVLEPKELVPAANLLSFAGIEKPRPLIVPFETQFAEKIHAYTLPKRAAARNTLHDFADLVLLLERANPNDYFLCNMEPVTLAFAVDRTFRRRASHEFPHSFPKPDSSLEAEFNALSISMNMHTTMDVASWKLTNLWLALTQILAYKGAKY